MTTKVYDLRLTLAPFLQRAWAPSAGEEAGDEDEGAVADRPEPGAAAPADDDEAEGDGKVRNPDLQRLSRECAKHRTAAKEALTRAEAAEAALTTAQADVAAASKLTAFLLGAAGQVNDLEAAWKLANQDGIRINDEGHVSGVAEVVAEVIQRYPYLTDTAADDSTAPTPFTAPGPSGRPMNGKGTNGSADGNRAVLQKKFPALKRR